MSDLNDELLNYEIGDVEADDTLTGADEDELLLSDDESISGKLSKEQGDLLLSSAVEKVSPPSVSSPPKAKDSVKNEAADASVTPPARSPSKRLTRRSAAISDELSEPSSVTTQPIHETPQIAVAATEVESSTCSEPQDTESSQQCETIESESSQNVQSDCDSLQPKHEPPTQTKSDLSDTEKSDNQSDVNKPLTSSQLTVSSTPNASDYDASANSEINDFEAEDSDESSERQNRNRKLCVEREQTNQSGEPSRSQQHQQHHHQHGSWKKQKMPFASGDRRANATNNNLNNNNNRHSIPRPPPPHHPYRMPMGENFGPPFIHPFGQPNRHAVNPLRAPFNRMPLQGAMNFQRVPPPPPPQSMQSIRGMMPGHRMPMPPMPGGGPNQQQYFGNMQPFPGQTPPVMPPRLRMPANMGPHNPHQQQPPQHPQKQPSQLPQQQPRHHPYAPQGPRPANMLLQRAPMHQLHPQSIHSNQSINPTTSAAVLPPQMPPRKVLLNPNFKGGVQAATTQLMMDTMKNSQMSREADLLRQQELFINQNRMHIEKRRRSRDYTPDRERSYSPPVRRRPPSRDRDARRPYGGSASYRGNRGGGRRANSRDLYENEHKHFETKRRRSGSFDRKNDDRNDQKTEEDEETRAYRLKIEKQKAMREEILRDKEMRRRRAAETVKNKDEDKKAPIDESAPKLKPIIVTEKKIISLKKKPDAIEQSKLKARPASDREIPTATVLPESKRLIAEQSTTTAIVKPVLKKSLPIDIDDDDDIDEDELLADSPPSPPSHKASATKSPNAKRILDSKTLKSVRTTLSTSNATETMFTNRRVIVRDSSDNVTSGKDVTSGKEKTSSSSATASAASTTAPPSKGIFDRLDKKVIGVNEAAKRKIQRIVIKNTD